jgi:hypothetical protein
VATSCALSQIKARANVASAWFRSAAARSLLLVVLAACRADPGIARFAP